MTIEMVCSEVPLNVLAFHAELKCLTSECHCDPQIQTSTKMITVSTTLYYHIPTTPTTASHKVDVYCLNSTSDWLMKNIASRHIKHSTPPRTLCNVIEDLEKKKKE